MNQDINDKTNHIAIATTEVEDISAYQVEGNEDHYAQDNDEEINEDS